MKALLSALFILICAASRTQEISKTPPAGLRSYTISLKAALAAPLREALAPIQYIDGRPDSTKLGYIPANSNSYYKIVTDQSLTTLFAPAMPQTQVSATGLSYLFVVRKLWLSETTVAEEKALKITLQRAPSNMRFGKCIARIEVYGQSNGAYYPLFRLDSVFAATQPLRFSAKDLLGLPFEYCINKLQAQNWASVLAKRKQMIYSDVTAFTFKNKIDPVQKIEMLIKGIFHRYADFLNNNADTTAFSVHEDALSDELTLHTSKGNQVLKDFWGFYDGKRLFVRLGLNLFPLYTAQNTFELWGFSSIVQHLNQSAPVHGNSGRDLLISTMMHALNTKRIEARLKPLQLDVESGSLY